MFHEVRPGMRHSLLDSNGTWVTCRDPLVSPAQDTRVQSKESTPKIQNNIVLNMSSIFKSCETRLPQAFAEEIPVIQEPFFFSFFPLNTLKNVLTAVGSTLTIIFCGSPPWDQTHLSILKALTEIRQTDGGYLVWGKKKEILFVKIMLLNPSKYLFYKYFSQCQKVNSYRWKTEVI